MANQIKRMRYFNGLFLKEDEFNLEQNYHIRMRRLHNRHLHTWGIVWGLDVKQHPTSPKKIMITEGMALNKVLEDGEEISQEIILTKDIERDLSGYKNDESVYIYISYSERKEFKDSQEEDVEQEEGKEPYWWERSLIDHSTDEPTDKSKFIILARVDVKDETLDIIYKEKDKLLRVDAGFSGKRLETERLTLSIKDAFSNLPFIEGKKFDSKNGLIINSKQINFTGLLTISDDLILEAKEIDGQKGLNINSPQTNFTGSLTIDGDLTVKGTTTTVNAETIEVKDNIIRVNKYKPQSTPQKINGGLEVFRGGSKKNPNAQIIWDEEESKWKIGLEGSLIDIAYSDKWKKKNWEQLTNALSIDEAGNIGIGTMDLKDKLVVSGNIRILTDSNPIRFSSNWIGFPDHVNNQAEFSNDTKNYKTLMIVGNKSAGLGRRVSIWDRLEVNGTLKVNGTMEIFGGWETMRSDTSYTAKTDGFIIVNGVGSYYRVEKSPPFPPKEILVESNARNANSSCITFPVRKGEQWKIKTLGGSSPRLITWIPLGT